MDPKINAQKKGHDAPITSLGLLVSATVLALSQTALARPMLTAPQPPSTPTTAVPVETAPSTGPQQHEFAGVTFIAPPGFSALQPLGGETVGILYPAAAAQTRHVSVRFADLTAVRQGISTLPLPDLAEYARFTFFGITNAPQQKQTRRFLGQPVTGDVLVQPNQTGGTSYIEFYLVPLSKQRQIAIAFETDTELPLSLFEQTVQSISDSLIEVTKKKKRR